MITADCKFELSYTTILVLQLDTKNLGDYMTIEQALTSRELR